MNLRQLSDVRPLYRRFLGRPVPLEVFERLYGQDRYGFLYESLEGHGAQGRYSFLGGRPRVVFKSKGDSIELRVADDVHRFTDHPLRALRELVRSGVHALPVSTFPGGAVGYAGYDLARLLAPIGGDTPDDLKLPDAHFVFPEEILIIDHLDEVVHLLLYRRRDQERRAREIEATLATGDAPAIGSPAPPTVEDAPLRSNVTEAAFRSAVLTAKDYIRAGDIFQVVLSQRFEFPLSVPALRVYSALRVTNPSPYMYYLNLDGMQVSGSSPEILVKLTGRRVVTRPLAGTRPRGTNAHEDEALARELLADEKERAEHVMLVDLTRNDLGRHCSAGSIRVEEYMQVERYSRVMHLVSQVTGRLRDDRDAFDLFASTFPAGTVSGAPKIRAMQIIDELEPVRRGPYAGAIGYFSFLGDMDLCIGIRTIVSTGDRAYLQAGAGIVADSVPEREHRETLSKAAAVAMAVHLAEGRQPVG